MHLCDLHPDHDAVDNRGHSKIPFEPFLWLLQLGNYHSDL